MCMCCMCRCEYVYVCVCVVRCVCMCVCVCVCTMHVCVHDIVQVQLKFGDVAKLSGHSNVEQCMIVEQTVRNLSFLATPIQNII